MAIARNSGHMPVEREVIIASASGFCGGVESTVSKAFDFVKNKLARRVVLDGELIHNPTASEWLFSQGKTYSGNIQKLKRKTRSLVGPKGLHRRVDSIWNILGVQLWNLRVCLSEVSQKLSKPTAVNELSF
jgi:hypothetical protein